MITFLAAATMALAVVQLVFIPRRLKNATTCNCALITTALWCLIYLLWM